MSTAHKLVEVPESREAEVEPLTLAAPPASALAAVLSRRRTHRDFGAGALDGTDLGALLWAGQGITSGDGNRTAPSAGAFHPTTLSVADERGISRYLPDRHALERVASGDRRPALAAAAYAQACVAAAGAVIAITARPEMLRLRYGRRSERYCAIEAGHVAQNVLLMAAELGLAAVPVGAFDDAAVLRELELESDHLPLYLLAVGNAPAPGADPLR